MLPMRLLRFAIISFSGDVGDWAVFTIEHEGCSVGTLRNQTSADESRTFIVAEVPLTEPPRADDAGMVGVPEGPRRKAEEAIEIAANSVSVATGHPRRLSTPNLAVAFRAEDDADQEWFDGKTGVVGADQGFAAARLTVAVGEAELTRISDRADGAELLGEALAQEHLMGQYRELLRVFERAFTLSGDRLVAPLSQFLASRSGLAYTKQEVRRWIVGLRGAAIHQDWDREVVVEADVRWVVDRMLLAAYEVLFNKRNWRSSDSARRGAWMPQIGPLDPNGRYFILQHSEPVLKAQLYDRFGAYVLDLEGPQFQLGDDCWPRQGPPTVTSPQPDIEVVPAERLAPQL
jgi:hypothetical protein